MERINRLLGAALLAGALVMGCARTTELEPGQKTSQPEKTVSVPDSITFTAVLENGTRTLLGTDEQVLWSTGDEIRVFNESNASGAVFTLKNGQGTPTGTFEGPNIGNGPFRAVYPASIVATGSQYDNISISIPSSQSYAAESFGAGANISVGQADQLDNILFRNVMGVLSLTLTGDATIGSICIQSHVQETLSGTATLSNLGEEAGPTLTFGEGQTAESFSRLTLDCGTNGIPLTSTGKTFHLAIPAGALGSGYQIEVYDTNGKVMVRYAKASEDNAIVRNYIVSMPELAYEPDYKAAFLQSTSIGAFSGTSAGSSGEMQSLCTYNENQSQYAYNNTETSRYLRLQDWDSGYALGLTMPYTLNPGKKYNVTLNQADGLDLSTTQPPFTKMRVAKKSEGKVWLQDATSGIGFILMLAEEDKL